MTNISTLFFFPDTHTHTDFFFFCFPSFFFLFCLILTFFNFSKLFPFLTCVYFWMCRLTFYFTCMWYTCNKITCILSNPKTNFFNCCMPSLIYMRASERAPLLSCFCLRVYASVCVRAKTPKDFFLFFFPLNFLESKDPPVSWLCCVYSIFQVLKNTREPNPLDWLPSQWQWYERNNSSVVIAWRPPLPPPLSAAAAAGAAIIYLLLRSTDHLLLFTLTFL